MGKMLNVKQVSEETGLSEYAIRDFVKQGVFPHIRVGATAKAKILMDIDEVKQAIKRMQNTGGTTTAKPDILKKYGTNAFALYSNTIIQSDKKIPIPRGFMTTLV